MAKALLGKDVLSDELPYVTGSIGLLGTRPSYELMRDCDTLLIVGSNFPYSQFLPEFGKARAIQIDIDGRLIGMRYPTEVNLVGDAQATLRRADPEAEAARTTGPGGTPSRRTSPRWWDTVERQALVEADPVNPMRIVVGAVQPRPRQRHRHRRLRVRRPTGTPGTCGCAANMRGSLSGTLATMGPAVPYAIGAKFAHPDRPVIALVGDGAMQMNGMAELITIARYHDAVVRSAVRDLRAAQQRPQPGHLGAARDGRRAEVRGVAGAARRRLRRLRPLARPRRGHGRPTRTSSAPPGRGALSATEPTVLDVHCDPEVPPIPPHATFEQMKAAAEAVLKGDPNAHAPDGAGREDQAAGDPAGEEVTS